MDYAKLKSLLQEKAKEAHQVWNAGAEVYISYLQKLEREKKKDGNSWVAANPWIAKLSEERAASLFASVAAKGLYIDGECVLLQTRGIEVVPEYTYNAYKNLVIAKYPDTVFDWGVVYEGDEYTFSKNNGKVTYTHKILNPFATNRNIVGAYGIIRNSSGEFIELINQTDIAKFRNIAKTKNVWDTWYDRMVLKSVIKRICTTAFKDVVKEIENEDNENYDLDRANINEDIQKELDECKVIADITNVYNKYISKVSDVNAFTALCSKRKQEIKANNGNS
jgi:hypothetical protein